MHRDRQDLAWPFPTLSLSGIHWVAEPCLVSCMSVCDITCVEGRTVLHLIKITCRDDANIPVQGLVGAHTSGAHRQLKQGTTRHHFTLA
jgi:hypothetical protein